MGKAKKNAKTGLGAALIKGQRKSKAELREQWKQNERVIAELGFESAAGTKKSVTETNNLEAFIADAVMAGRRFAAQRETRLIEVANEGEDARNAKEIDNEEFDESTLYDFKSLPIPRRPPWTHDMTAEELDRNERDSFLKWRRAIASLEARNPGLQVSPFEKNLDFWRQLWRVVERSDLVVQVVDARNPLLFRCADVEKFTKETAPHKSNLLLINKSDFLSIDQRLAWKQYFMDNDIKFIFFSARLEQDKLDAGDEQEENSSDGEDILEHSSEILATRKQLLHIMEKLAKEAAALDTDPKRPTRAPSNSKPCVGMIGYPNVGKSSVINVVVGVTAKDHQSTRVSVAATPGHTKHFQTLHLSNKTILCDCPGLVFPTFMSTKADLLCNGILPIDEIRGRDFFPAVQLIARCIPREVFEKTYVMQFPLAPTIHSVPAEMLIEVFCEKRGLFGSGHGRYNEAHGSRVLLKHFVNGKLCHCNPPPSDDGFMTSKVLSKFIEHAEDDEFDRENGEDSAEHLLEYDMEGLELDDEDEMLVSSSKVITGGAAAVGVADLEITEADLALLASEDQLLYTETQKIESSIKSAGNGKRQKKKKEGKGHKGRQANPYGAGDYFDVKRTGKYASSFTRIIRPWDPSADGDSAI